MSLKIDLPNQVQETLKNKARAAGVSAERYAQRVLERDLQAEAHGVEGPKGALQATVDMILERMGKLPPEAFAGLPADGASQHDHYIYGTPKREP
jgi:hypothetical protein